MSRPLGKSPLPRSAADFDLQTVCRIRTHARVFAKEHVVVKLYRLYASYFWAFLKPSHRGIAFGRDAASLRRLTDDQLALPLSGTCRMLRVRSQESRAEEISLLHVDLEEVSLRFRSPFQPLTRM